jgi:CBS domain-containing protein
MTIDTEQRVADLMTENVVTVGRDDLLHDAIRKMEIELMSALPVVDSAGKVCGILSNSDLVQLTYNLQCDVATLSAVPNLVRKTMTDMIAEDNCDTKVSAAMTSTVETISSSATITDAAQSMIGNAIHHLPVVDDSGVPIGIVSTLDIVRAVAFPSAEE